MSNPGAGRYTSYLPQNIKIAPSSNANYTTRYARFNNLSAAGPGDFLGLTAASQKVMVDAAIVKLTAGEGDVIMFPTLAVDSPAGVKLDFSSAQALSTTSISRVGDPINPYMPDVASPGAGAQGVVNLTPLAVADRKAIPAVTTTVGDVTTVGFKSNYVLPTSTVSQAAANLGTQSPNNTSTNLGTTSIGSTSLTMGKSRGTA